MLFIQEYNNACNQCGLYSDNNQSVTMLNTSSSEILIIKDIPSYEEYVHKTCNIGKINSFLDSYSLAANVDKDKLAITNAVRCYVDGGIKENNIKYCKQFLDKEINKLHPKVIITLGMVTYYSLFHKKLSEKEINSPVFNNYYGCWIIPSHSFNNIYTTKKYQDEFIQSLQLANKIVNEEKWKEKTVLDYKLILTQEDFDEVIEEIKTKRFLAVDIETTGLQIHVDKILGIGFSWKECQGIYIPFLFQGILTNTYFYENKENINKLKEILQNDSIKIFHNGQFDTRFLTRDFGKVNNFNFDTLLASFLVDENMRHDLGSLGDEFKDIRGWKKSFKNKANKLGYTGTSLEDLGIYCCGDCDVTFRLFNKYFPIMEKEYKQLYNGLLVPMSKLMMEVELNGVKVDVEYLKELIKEYEDISKEAEEKVYTLFGRQFLIDSPQQLANILYKELKLPVVKYNKLSETAKKKNLPKTPSTDEEALSILLKTLDKEKKKKELEILENLLIFRKSNKLLRTYFKPSLEDRDTNDRIHPNYSLTTARTGRTSSNSPNIQNLPNKEKIRKYVIAKKGYKFLIADFRQAEVRVLASFSKDDLLKESVYAEDFHSKTASDIFDVPVEEVTKIQRTSSKSITFGISYGIKADSLQESINSKIPDESQHVSVEDCQTYIDKYFNKYNKVKEYQDKLKKQILEKHYLDTPLGRKRRFQIFSNMTDQQLNRIYNQGLNFPIQAHASDLLLILSLRIDKRIKEENLDANMVIFCHDELVIEAKEDLIERIKIILEEERSKPFPSIDVDMAMSVDIKKHWI